LILIRIIFDFGEILFIKSLVPFNEGVRLSDAVTCDEPLEITLWVRRSFQKSERINPWRLRQSRDFGTRASTDIGTMG
jgi:hypothetical protein